MKQSNLALRADVTEPDNPVDQPESRPEAMSPAEQRLARTRAMGMNYRAISIAAYDLPLFRVR